MGRHMTYVVARRSLNTDPDGAPNAAGDIRRSLVWDHQGRVWIANSKSARPWQKDSRSSRLGGCAIVMTIGGSGSKNVMLVLLTGVVPGG